MSEVNDTQEQPKVEIEVENFGPIAEAKIDLRPLTVFVGPSNTGKTYFCTLLYMMHTVFRKSYDFPATESTNTAEHIQEETSDNKLTALEIVELALERYFDIPSVFDLIRYSGNGNDYLKFIIKCIYPDEKNPYFSFIIRDAKISTRETSPGRPAYLRSKNINQSKWYFLPATRNGILQSHRFVASSLMEKTLRKNSGHIHIPTLSAVVVDYMQYLTLYQENNKPNPIVTEIVDALESHILGGKIDIDSSQNGYPEIKFQPKEIGQSISATGTSSMVSELAPLVLYLRGYVQPGDTLIIEEPEAHLHPGAQADMAVILARLVRAGVKVIITTHSDWLLEEIGNLILEGLIEDKTDEPASWLLPEEVGAWHFQKEKPVKEIEFHSRKGFSPKDYQDVAEGLYNRSVNLQQKYEKQKGKSRRESTGSS